MRISITALEKIISVRNYYLRFFLEKMGKFIFENLRIHTIYFYYGDLTHRENFNCVGQLEIDQAGYI